MTSMTERLARRVDVVARRLAYRTFWTDTTAEVDLDAERRLWTALAETADYRAQAVELLDLILDLMRQERKEQSGADATPAPASDGLRITITQSAKDAENMADLLEEIARQLRNGNTSGYYPHWSLEGEETSSIEGERRKVTDCVCVVTCADDSSTACSLSGTPHVHPNNGLGVFGPCPIHPDAPGDL